MKTIEIATAHNIIFNYGLASVMQRIVAYGIDLGIMLIYATIVSIIITPSTPLWMMCVFLVLMLYHFLMESLNRGQSIGKMILKIRVVTLRGKTPTAQDLFIRWIFRMIDITFTVGTLGIINILASEKHQRIGDLMARTTVISLKNSNHLKLEGILKLNSQTKELQYPGVRMFNDKDMILLKQTLDRASRFPTNENKSFLKKLGVRIFEDLGLDVSNLSAKVLRDILNDYILTTRK